MMKSLCSRRYVFQVFCVFVLLTALSTPLEGRDEVLPDIRNRSISLQYPPDRSVMKFGPLGVSLKVEKGFSGRIEVLLNGKEARQIVPDKEFECFSLSLQPGINRVVIRSGQAETERESISFTVFLISELEQKFNTPPVDYQKNYFHMGDHPECGECHTLIPGERDLRPPGVFAGAGENQGAGMNSAPQGSTCYSCHRGIASAGFVHGPASVWACLSCHDHQAIPAYSPKGQEAEMCFSCHTEQKRDWEEKKTIHGPVSMGKCLICHNPHGSEHPYSLVKQSWDLCVSCHAEKATGRHIFVGFFYDEGHPTRDRPDPLREGRELSCASCHNPHASYSPKLWSMNAQSQYELCQKCHKY